MPRNRTRKTYRLRYQPPYDFAALLAFFARRAIPSVERIDATGYERDFVIDGDVGRLRVEQGAGDALKLTVDFPDVKRHADVAAHVRRMFDTDADIAAINRALARNRYLKKCIKLNPGQRLPGGWDVFEFAIRAVLGQQISVAAARTFTQRLVERFGQRVIDVDGEPIHLFPEPAALADVDLTVIGLVRARAAALNAIARAVRDGTVSVDRDQALDEFVAAWTQLPGIGDWTAHYIAMRALSHTDAFPAADLVLRRAVARNGVPVLTARTARDRAALAAVARVRRAAFMASRGAMKTGYDFHASPVGTLLLAMNERGLSHLYFDKGRHALPVQPEWTHDPARFDSVRRQIDAYFAGTLQAFDLPLAPTGSDFQLAVWEELKKIPYGATTSYGAIARTLGDVSASRAVGAANGQNPISIIVPCHRVIGSSGQLVGYGGGLPTKRFLIDLEQRHCAFALTP